MSEPTNPGPVTAFLAACNAHDWAGAVALYTPDASHTEAATGKSRAGTEALTAGLAGFGAMMPDACWNEVERILSGPHVLLRYELSGTFGTPGRALRLPGVFMFTLTATGRIAATTDFWDKDAFLAQIRQD